MSKRKDPRSVMITIPFRDGKELLTVTHPFRIERVRTRQLKSGLKLEFYLRPESEDEIKKRHRI